MVGNELYPRSDGDTPRNHVSMLGSLAVKAGDSSPTNTPNYEEAPDDFSGMTIEEIQKLRHLRGIQHCALTAPKPTFGMAESLGSLVAHIEQIDGELARRGVIFVSNPVGR